MISYLLLSNGPTIFLSINHNQPRKGVVAKIVHFFCGTRFFAKLSNYLIEHNKITCPRSFFFPPPFSKKKKMDNTIDTTLSYFQIAFYTMNKILNENINFIRCLYFSRYIIWYDTKKSKINSWYDLRFDNYASHFSKHPL